MYIIKRIHRDQSVPECVAKKLHELQKSGELCDYELTTEDGGSFKVHKWILSAVSPFFHKLLNLNAEFCERDSDTFLVRRVTSDILEKIIEFIYTGKTEISSDTAKELIDLALFLNLFNLVKYGCSVLAEVVDEDNCLELLKYSETCLHYGQDLTRKCLKVICKKFNDFVNLPDFLELSADTIELLIVQERTTYTEENLYLAVKKWIKFDLENRKQFVKCLFDSIQLEHFTSEFAKAHVFNDCPLLQAKGLNDKLFSLFRNKWTQEENFASQKEGNLCVVTGNEMLFYDNGDHNVFKTVTYVKENYLDFSCTTLDKNVFLCGGKIDGKVVNTCSYFSAEDYKWKDLPSMEVARCPKTITLDKKIYACGGLNNIQHRTVEFFDINQTCWFETCSLNSYSSTSSIGLCNLNDCIYFANQYCVQRLDPRQYWDTLYSGDLQKVIHSLEAFDNYIYGFTDNNISTFDIRNNKWLETVLPYKTTCDTSRKTCVLDNQIYVSSYKTSHDGNSTKFQLQSYNLSDLSFCEFKYVSANVKGNFKDFFSL